MAIILKSFLAISIAACGLVLSTVSASSAQGYAPSTPTVSPYLNLFQNRRNGVTNRALPNYYLLVRPQLQQNQFNANQQQLLNQQDQSIQQLQSNVLTLQQPQGGHQIVTGHNSWFQNTSGYFARAGTAGAGHAQGQGAHYTAQSGPTSFARGR